MGRLPVLLAAASLAAAAATTTPSLEAQDLTPRAYVITPVRSNAVNLGYIFNDGELLFEGTVCSIRRSWPSARGSATRSSASR
jgi:hypothetical protein